MTQTTQTSVQLPSNNGATDYNVKNVHTLIARAHLLRAEAFSNDIAAIESGLKKLVSNVQSYFSSKATVRPLETPSAPVYSDKNIHMIVARAHLLRAEAFSNDIAAIVSGLKKLASNVQTYFRARATARTLESLSDTVLADIGIERAQIPSITRALRNGTYGTVAAVAPSATIETFGRKDADTTAVDPSEMPLAA